MSEDDATEAFQNGTETLRAIGLVDPLLEGIDQKKRNLRESLSLVFEVLKMSLFGDEGLFPGGG